MQFTTKLACAGTLWLGLSHSAFAQENNGAQEQRASKEPIFISTDTLVGCKATCHNQAEDTIADALVDPSTGCVQAFIMKSGALQSAESLRWDASNKCFVPASSKANSSKLMNASSSQSNSQEDLEQSFLLSKVIEYPLMGTKRTDAGYSDDKLGSIGGAFMDVRSGQLAYVTTSVGGVLGIGAESRVIPWAAVHIRRNDAGQHTFRSSISEKRLDKAPAVGEGPDNLNNPDYRDTLYSYYGVRRADFEPTTKESASVVPMERILGATIARASGNDEILTDLVLNPESGQVAYALCKSGKVMPIDAFTWNAFEKRFRVKDNVTGSTLEADKGRHLLASALTEFTVMCAGEKCGELEDIYFDTDKKRIAYLSVSGDSVRVLPWSLIAIHAVGEKQQLHLNCSREILNSAPELDGKVGATIYSPAFRSRVDTHAGDKSN